MDNLEIYIFLCILAFCPQAKSFLWLFFQAHSKVNVFKNFGYSIYVCEKQKNKGLAVCYHVSGKFANAQSSNHRFFSSCRSLSSDFCFDFGYLLPRHRRESVQLHVLRNVLLHMWAHCSSPPTVLAHRFLRPHLCNVWPEIFYQGALTRTR